MTKTIKVLFVLAFAASLAFAQYPITTIVSNPLVSSTTLSSAVAARDTQFCIASATGVVIPSVSIAGSYLFVDREMVQVSGAGISSTCFKVKRGLNGTQAQQHPNTATVWLGNQATSSGDPSRPTGTGSLFPLEDASPTHLNTVQPAFGTTPSVAASVSGTTYWSEITVEHNRPVTGACVLNGATVGTDKYIFALYDFAGNLLANSAIAGTTTASASLYQCLPFVTPLEISGLRTYFLAVQQNGTTDLFKKYITGEVGLSFQAGSSTGTFGTLINPLLVPATFTTAVGPIGALY